MLKTLRRSLLILVLALGAGACSTPIMGPDYGPDAGNYGPDGGNYGTDGGN